MESQLHPLHQLVRELGNEFLWELVWSIHVVAAGDQAGDFERSKIGFDQELSACFCRCIRIGWFQYVLLRHWISLKIFSFTIHLVSRNVYKPLDCFAYLCTFKKHVSAVNVRVGEGEGISERVVNMGLGSEVENCIDLLLPQHIAHQIRCSNITLDELVIRQALEFAQILQARAIVQTIINNDLILRILLAE